MTEDGRKADPRPAPWDTSGFAPLARRGFPHLLRQEQDARLRLLHTDTQEHLRRATASQQVQGVPLQRDIYSTTIEYLSAFPVHYGLVDAYISADGPFGIFADAAPNATLTVIGGADLVAVDWVAATKMGIDPMISPYMSSR